MRSFVSDKKWARECFSALLMALVILVFAGCAGQRLMTSPGEEEAQKKAPPASEETQGELKVTSINVMGDGDSVLITTNRPAKYTSFELTSPPRLVIDLPEANLYDVLETKKVNNKFLKTINVVTYGGKEKIGRIILELQEGVDHEVKSTEDGVLIKLRHDPLANLPEGSLEDENVVVASAKGETVASGKAAEEAGPVAKTEPEPMEPATTIEELQSYREDSETVIQIISDGRLGKYNTFELSDPARVVIDVWEVKNKTGVKTLIVDSDDIKDVRVGNHPDKVRFVIDLAGAEIPPYVVTRSGDHIMATFRPAQAEMGSGEVASPDDAGAGASVEDAAVTGGAAQESALAEDASAGDGEAATGISNVAYEDGVGAAGPARARLA